MNPLIPTQVREIGGARQEMVDARDIWKFVRSYTQFSAWVKTKIVRHGFVENKDYLRLKVARQIPHRWGSRTSHQIDYFFTVDAARTIGTVEVNPAQNI